MALEIRELVIKVTIESDTASAATDIKEQVREIEERVIEKCLEQIQRKIDKSFDR